MRSARAAVLMPLFSGSKPCASNSMFSHEIGRELWLDDHRDLLSLVARARRFQSRATHCKPHCNYGAKEEDLGREDYCDLERGTANGLIGL